MENFKNTPSENCQKDYWIKDLPVTESNPFADNTIYKTRVYVSN
jgi:hypothetical protein